MIVLETRARARGAVALLLAGALLLAACGDDEGSASAEGPTIAVTTSILADVVGELVGDQAEVVAVMPRGADPHEFQASAQEVDRVRRADALVLNGGGFEEGLLDLADAVAEDGMPVHEVVGADGDAAHEDGEDEHGEDEHGHEDGGDAHFFTDPVRMDEAVEGISAFLAAEVPGLDVEALEQATAAYRDELRALDAEVEALLAGIPESRRVLVTGHDVLGAFADRYGFEVVGTVIPSGSTSDGGNAGDLAELADAVRDAGVRAVFVDSSAADRLARTLAAEAGDIEVRTLFTESLGEPGSGAETYLDMVRTNAERIAGVLADGAP